MEDGARTGEISGAMLAEVGASHVLVGHSERRQLLGESNESVGAKFRSALEAGLTPILCVGETLAEREGMRTEAVIATQLQAVADVVGAGALERGIIAYEPVWAIGTGRNATPSRRKAFTPLFATGSPLKPIAPRLSGNASFTGAVSSPIMRRPCSPCRMSMAASSEALH